MILPLFFGTRFAPRPPQRLAALFRGAKSSQKIRAAACRRRPFQRRDLLPTPRKALRLRFGEQNLHRSSAPPRVTDGLFSGAICSPPLTKPCDTVPGSKIFTEIPRRRLSACRLCWRRPAGKRLCHRRATPTGRPESRPEADHVGAASPAKPYLTVGPRQQGAPNPARRPTMLAPPLRQSHISPSDSANRAPRFPPGGRLCWRRPAGKRLCHRRATPTGRPKSHPAAVCVGAAPPAKPYGIVGSRQQGTKAMREEKKTADTYPF